MKGKKADASQRRIFPLSAASVSGSSAKSASSRQEKGSLLGSGVAQSHSARGDSTDIVQIVPADVSESAPALRGGEPLGGGAVSSRRTRLMPLVGEDMD